MATPIRVEVGPADAHRALIAVAALGVGFAAFLAVFGLPGADLHGPLHRAGIMDPLCGGTRALRLAARGQFASSLWWNPLSLVLLAGAIAYFGRTVVGFTSGRWLNILVRWRDRRVWLVVAAAIIVLEIRQQAMRDVLMRPGY